MFEKLFKNNYRQLFAFAHTILYDEEECHDVIYEALEEVWSHRETLQDSTARSYLYTTVRNLSINHLRRRKTHAQYIDYVIHMTQPYVNPDELIERDERDQAIRQAIRQLEPPTDTIFRRCYLEGIKYQKVADELGMSLSNVKKHMNIAFRLIKEAVLKKYTNS